MYATLPGNDRIAVRERHGVTQYRAYSQGVAHPDGGNGPWLEDLAGVERILRDAELIDLADRIVTA